MSESKFQYDPEVIRELRTMALDGAPPVELIRHIQVKEGIAADSVLVTLAYLRHAFWVPLSVLLPLREEMGIGPDSDRLRVVFWFAAAMLHGGDALPWDRYTFESTRKYKLGLRKLPADGGARLEYCQTATQGLFARGSFTVILDECTPDLVIRERIRRFAEEYRHMLEHHGYSSDFSSRMTLGFQLASDGPGCRVICMVQTLREQQSLASV